MRLIEWMDGEGYKHLSWIKDNDPDTAGPQGIPADPPDLDQLDWNGLKRDLHNALVERRLTDWQAVQRQQDGVTASILGVFKRNIIGLYRQGVNDG